MDNQSTRNLKLMSDLDPQSVYSIELNPKFGEQSIARTGNVGGKSRGFRRISENF